MEERIIYKFTNLLTNRFYIGSTARPDGRKAEYFNCNRSSLNEQVIKSIEEYGIENHTWEIYITLPSVISITQMIQIEHRFIKSLLSVGVDLMNIYGRPYTRPCPGHYERKGRGALKTTNEKSKKGYIQKRKLIKELNDTGEVISTYESIYDFAQFEGISYIAAQRIIRGEAETERTFEFVYGMKKRNNKPREFGVGYKRKVEQLNKNTGAFIQSFDSMLDAERETGVAQPNISSCCSGRLLTAGGFKWKYIK